MDKVFVSGIKIKKEIPKENYLSDLSVIKNLIKQGELKFNSPITFFVGENGIGKSTLIEAIAVNFGFPAEGGTKDYNYYTKNTHSDLYDYITLVKTTNFAKNGYFLRAESFYNTISYMDFLDKEQYSDNDYFQHLRKDDTGYSNHNMSHGEGFLNIAAGRFTGNGIYVLDEPEAALSPTGIMKLMCIIDECVKKGSQFIISTHSPILITIPNSAIYQLTETEIKEVNYNETLHYIITRKFLENPKSMLDTLFDK